MRRIAAACLLATLGGGTLAALSRQDSGLSIETVSITPAGQPAGDKREGADGSTMTVLSHTEHTLIIEDLRLGTGDECDRRSEVTVHYHGTLADGTEFDSTRGEEPATFPLNRLIPGWQAGVPGMKVGGVRRLVIPPVMAYGAKDRLDPETGKVSIPANSTLVFAIELVKVKAPPAQAALPPGLKIEDLVVGTGKECTPGATVVMHYRGTLQDGTPFDASYDRQVPLVCSLKPGGTPEAMGVITGWQQGVPGMRVGGKRRMTIPPELAYGAAGRPGIPPNSTLIFEVELLEVK